MQALALLMIAFAYGLSGDGGALTARIFRACLGLVAAMILAICVFMAVHT